MPGSPERKEGGRPRPLARGRMRRRLRRQQRVREALLLDLGALVFELHRQGRREPELLQAKAAELTAVDGEVRALSDALDAGEETFELVAAGIAGSCSICGALLTTDARYCPSCGAPVSPELAGGDGGEVRPGEAPRGDRAALGAAGMPAEELHVPETGEPAPTRDEAAAEQPTTEEPSVEEEQEPAASEEAAAPEETAAAEETAAPEEPAAPEETAAPEEPAAPPEVRAATPGESEPAAATPGKRVPEGGAAIDQLGRALGVALRRGREWLRRQGG